MKSQDNLQGVAGVAGLPSASNINERDANSSVGKPALAAGNLGECRTERRDGEGVTEFTIRRIRNEIIEECAKAGEKAWPRAHTYASENADIYCGQDHAVRTVVTAIRKLKQ